MTHRISSVAAAAILAALLHAPLSAQSRITGRVLDAGSSTPVPGNLSRGRFRNAPVGENHIPLAPTLTSTGGLLAQGESPLSAGLRYRFIGARAADESNTVRARQSHIWQPSARCNCAAFG